jgi:hypothetical protein
MGEFWLGCLKERDHMVDLDILEHDIEMDHEDRGRECMEWINLAQDSDKQGISWLAGLWCMVLVSLLYTVFAKVG